MPEISRFLGMVIQMYYNDRNPPHFQVRYGSHRALITIEGLEVLEGGLPTQALSLAREWVVSTLMSYVMIGNWRVKTGRSFR